MGSVGVGIKREIALRIPWRVWAIVGRCAQCLVRMGEHERLYKSRMSEW